VEQEVDAETLAPTCNMPPKMAGQLLIIDDFGLKPLRAPADEDLHDLIAERYEQAATIVTSNLDFTEWDQAFPANRQPGPAAPKRLLPLARRPVLPSAKAVRLHRPSRAAKDLKIHC
jgi:DNA replication protein DnaC